jgi:hypothetical protein
MSTSSPRLRPQLIADVVTASYIHDISVRHRGAGSSKQLANVPQARVPAPRREHNTPGAEPWPRVALARA